MLTYVVTVVTLRSFSCLLYEKILNIKRKKKDNK